jgi:formylglycine-generating enzyme required for sulfatase activity
MGLQIFNTTTGCVETWNGAAWILACDCGDHPCPPYVSGITGACLKEAPPLTYAFDPDDYVADPSSVITPSQYEFFDGATSVYKGANSSYTFAAAPSGEVMVSLYYPAFTQPAVADQTFSNVNGSTISFTMKGVQGSTFTMGATDTDWSSVLAEAHTGSASTSFDDEMSVVFGGSGLTYRQYLGEHSVNVSSFCMSETEVTQGLWQAVWGSNDYNPAPTGYSYAENEYFGWSNSGGIGDNYPAYYISWYDAIAFCNKLSILLNKEPVYTVSGVDFSTLTYDQIPARYDSDWNVAVMDKTKTGFRLPTEAEWEYAASGGLYDTGKAYSGSDNLCEVGWYYDNATNSSSDVCPDNTLYGSQPVGGKTPNELGFYDMSGNVYEWCFDRGNQYPYCGRVENPVNLDASDPVGGHIRIIRGGCWYYSASNSLVSYRTNIGIPYDHSNDFGLRIVCK